MFKRCTFKERSRRTLVPAGSTYGYKLILWECGRCGHRIELPGQQRISYCPHCGARIREMRQA